MTVMDSLSNILWYDAPAANWDEALPVGNGRLGGMIFGKPTDELIQLNEDSIWSGGFRKRNNPNAYANLENIRELIRDGKPSEAEKLCEEAFYGRNENQRHYHPMGDLHILQQAAKGGAEEYTNYKRTLDISRAVCETTWTSGGVNFTRKAFVSAPDNVMAIIFTADKKGSISFCAYIDGKDDDYDKNEAYDDSTVIFTMSDGIPYTTALSCSAGEEAPIDSTVATIEMSDKGYTLEITVTPEQAKKVRVGDEADIQYFWYGDASAVLQSISPDKSNPAQGRILKFAVTGDVTPGQNLQIAMGSKGQRYETIVPNSAVREDSNGKFVLAVVAKSSPLGNRYMAQRLDVEVLASDDTSSAVTGDFLGGEFIVTTSTKPIEPGMQVRLVE